MHTTASSLVAIAQHFFLFFFICQSTKI